MLCGAQGRCGGAWSPRCRIPEQVISAFRGHTCSLSLPGSHSHGAQACRCLLSAEAGSGSGQIQKASEPTEDLPAPASPSCLQRVPWLLCHQRVGLAGIVPCLCSAPSRLPASGAPGESCCLVHQKHVPQISVPMHIIRDVGETPKIKELQAQPLGTIVNGLFAVLKVMKLLSTFVQHENQQIGLHSY
ncbi:uncharacterized protein LOC111094466 isoform X1 [Canis lupus familiaris]|uniref:uncharacterized protein LOC111094466 isoform X1 n=1 Tax=Canis lupus familiaris TaxID=9615 RepID=UPI0018F481EC|nr:uncharacterized protein LOC111094466 isoform X1 [Canis lupus familiaris]XP_038442328.1 uncharacterized protein LOC111094466 isoform X1 [Canis lupus familiaris]